METNALARFYLCGEPVPMFSQRPKLGLPFFGRVRRCHGVGFAAKAKSTSGIQINACVEARLPAISDPCRSANFAPCVGVQLLTNSDPCGVCGERADYTMGSGVLRGGRDRCWLAIFDRGGYEMRVS